MSIANNKKVKFDGARCPFSTFLGLQGDHHCACAQKWCHFSFFFKSFHTKKIKALRPKMTNIASRGGGGSCLNGTVTMNICRRGGGCPRDLRQLATSAFSVFRQDEVCSSDLRGYQELAGGGCTLKVAYLTGGSLQSVPPGGTLVTNFDATW